MKQIAIFAIVALLVAGYFSFDVPYCATPQPKPAKRLIRPIYKKGRKLRYKLDLAGETRWTPESDDFHWFEMSTSFTFTLSTKALRPGGLCTFDLIGEELESEGKGPDGNFNVEADRKKARIKINSDLKLKPETPLTKPMTITLGSLGGYRFSTGLAPIAIYAIPHVDKRFWSLLTLAPANKVAPGDSWKQELELRLPETKGDPLKAKGEWKVIGWGTYKNRNVLAASLTIELELKNSEITLKNGDRVIVSAGSCKAHGNVLWDVDNGVLCYAAAAQEISITINKPYMKTLESKASSTLELLGFQESE